MSKLHERPHREKDRAAGVGKSIQTDAIGGFAHPWRVFSPGDPFSRTGSLSLLQDTR